MASKTAAAKARAKSEKQLYKEFRDRRPNLSAIYRRRLPSVEGGSWEFRFKLIRPGARAMDLTHDVEALSWQEEENEVTGTMTVRRRDPRKPLPIGAGHRLRCSVGFGGTWWNLWEMSVKPPSWSLDAGTGEFELSDDLEVLKSVRRDWSFRTTKKRGKGWYAHEIAAEVAKREGLKVRKLAKGTKRIRRLVKKNATAWEILREAYKQERDHSKQRFVIRMYNGRLDIVALSRNEIAWEFNDDDVLEAAVEQSQSRRPSTVIKGTGRTGKGSSSKKVKVTVASNAASRRFGRKVKEKDYGRVNSVAELRFKAKRTLANALRITRKGQIDVVGVPFIRRGDCIRWITPEPGWKGGSDEIRDRSYVYVTSVSHQIGSGGDYTMSLGITQQDPYRKALQQRDKEMREAARKRRQKKKGK